jgi:hypothetical protein
MLLRAFTPAALACVLAMPFGAAAAQGFRYAPGTRQYRLTVQAKITQTVMGQSNDINMSSGQKFTMTLANQAADTLAMSATIDSIAQDMGQLGPVPGMEDLVGQKVSALLSPAGRYYAESTKPTDSIPALAGVASQLEHILPYIRVVPAAGVAWTDTLSDTVSQSGLEVKRQVISTYTVAGDTSIAGARSWKINRVSSSTSTGSGMVQGQMASMDGTSKGTGQLFIGHDGAFIGGTGTEDVVAKLSLPGAGVTYDVTTTATTRIELVK